MFITRCHSNAYVPLEIYAGVSYTYFINIKYIINISLSLRFSWLLYILNETILTALIAYIWYYTFLGTRRFEHFAVVRVHG